MSQILEAAPELGSAGLGLLAVILAVYLAIQAIALVRGLVIQKRTGLPCGTSNGSNGNGRLERLRMICPLSPGEHSLDDVHTVLTGMASSLDDLNRAQSDANRQASNRNTKLGEVLTAIRLQIADARKE